MNFFHLCFKFYKKGNKKIVVWGQQVRVPVLDHLNSYGKLFDCS